MGIPDVVRALERDLRAIFGARLQSLVIYHPATDAADAPIPTLATVDALSTDDLRACASRVESWHDAGLATPLVLAASEFGQSLDAFPLEFGAILADHTIVLGRDPFTDLHVQPTDLRRACEVQARSHLLHLREGYIESRGRSDRLATLVSDSVEPLAGLVKSVARLLGPPAKSGAEAAAIIERAASLPSGSLTAVLTMQPVTGEAARRVFPGYLRAIEELTHLVDRWSRA